MVRGVSAKADIFQLILSSCRLQKISTAFLQLPRLLNATNRIFATTKNIAKMHTIKYNALEKVRCDRIFSPTQENSACLFSHYCRQRAGSRMVKRIACKRTSTHRHRLIASTVAMACGYAAMSPNWKRSLGNTNGFTDETHGARITLSLR